MPDRYELAGRAIRSALKEIFKDVSGYPLNVFGATYDNGLAQGALQLSPAVTALYNWLRDIWAAIASESGMRPPWSLASILQLLERIKAASNEVHARWRRGVSGDALAQWVLQNYSLTSLQTVTVRISTGIDFAARLSVIRPHGVTRAPRHSASSHTVTLAPPSRRSTQSYNLPPTIPGIALPSSHQAGRTLPPIETYEEWLARRGRGQHSLAKEDQRLGSFVTARKAAIYGTTPEEWIVRAARRC